MKKKEIKEIILIFISMAVIGLIGAFGCGDLSTEDTVSGQTGGQYSNQSDDESKISGLVTGDYSDIFTSTMRFDDDDEGSALTLSSSLEGSSPIPPWYRSIPTRSREINIDIVDDIAYVTVTRYPEGTLKIDPYSDGDFDWEKKIEDQIYREATFEYSGGEWELTELTPAQFNMRDTEEQTVEIISVLVSKYDEEVGDYVSYWPEDGPLTDPLQKFSFPDDIPTFHPEDKVRVEVEIENSNGATYCYLHHRSHNNANRGAREYMYDDGENEGDQFEADDVFTGQYKIGSETGYYHAGVDCLDEGTIQNEEDPYNFEGWGMPYRVVAE